MVDFGMLLVLLAGAVLMCLGGWTMYALLRAPIPTVPPELDVFD
jgi:hypothetical protein